MTNILEKILDQKKLEIAALDAVSLAPRRRAESNAQRFSCRNQAPPLRDSSEPDR